MEAEKPSANAALTGGASRAENLECSEDREAVLRATDEILELAGTGDLYVVEQALEGYEKILDSFFGADVYNLGGYHYSQSPLQSTIPSYVRPEGATYVKEFGRVQDYTDADIGFSWNEAESNPNFHDQIMRLCADVAARAYNDCPKDMPDDLVELQDTYGRNNHLY